MTLDAAPRRVVHAIGAMTESVTRFVIPAIDVLHHVGVRQHVLVMDDGGEREVIEGQLPSGVSLTVIDEQLSAWRRSRAWMEALRDIRAAGTLDVLHAHGVAALTLLAAMGRADAPRRLVYSPHGSWDTRQPSRWRSMASEMLALPIRSVHAGIVVSSHHRSGRALGSRPGAVTAIHPALHPAFQSIGRIPNAEPLVVASATGKSQRAVTVLAQLSVLAAHGAGGAPVFQWSGECDAAGARILNAAGIDICHDQDPMQRAARLSRALVFVNCGSENAFPWSVAEAMACGLPVVSLDTPHNRLMVVDGVTGYLCHSAEAMLGPLLALISQPQLRRSIGDAARQRMLDEFGPDIFMRRMLEAYGLDDLARVDSKDQARRPRRAG